MNYPTKVMSMKALVKMGISESFLRRAYTDKSTQIAWRADPTRPNSKIMFDTEALEVFRVKQIALEKKMIANVV